MDPTLIREILYVAATVIATAFLKMWTSIAQSKASTSNHAATLETLTKKAATAVGEVEQTERAALPAELSGAEREKLKTSALVKLQSFARQEFGELLDQGYDRSAIECLQRSLIENAVRQLGSSAGSGKVGP